MGSNRHIRENTRNATRGRIIARHNYRSEKVLCIRNARPKAVGGAGKATTLRGPADEI